MFDFDAGKLLIIGIIALIVIGPKELPAVLRQLGQMVARMRRMAAEFQSQFTEAMREAELHDLQKDVAKVHEVVTADLNPLAHVSAELNAAHSEITTAVEYVPKAFDVPQDMLTMVDVPVSAEAEVAHETAGHSLAHPATPSTPTQA
jgi:sec-independent protein translocase protein TatB